MNIEIPKTAFEKWRDQQPNHTNLSNFICRLFELYQYADGTNRAKLNKAFPELFVNEL